MNTLHHAYIVFGQNETADSFVNRLALDIKKEYSLNVEGIKFEFDNISVENVDEIARATRIIPQTGFARIVSVKGAGISTSSQHALLKTLEEPIPDTYICIFLSHEIPLMPTVTSRVRVVRQISRIVDDEKIKDFIKASQAERLEMTKDLLAQYDKEKINKSGIIHFLESLVREAKKNFKGKATDERLKSILLVETYMRDTNASLKQCLELLALSL